MLGCAQPTCMAGPIDNEDDSLFHLDAQGQPDGYFREGDRLGQAIDTNKARAVSTLTWEIPSRSSKFSTDLAAIHRNIFLPKMVLPKF